MCHYQVAVYNRPLRIYTVSAVCEQENTGARNDRKASCLKSSSGVGGRGGRRRPDRARVRAIGLEGVRRKRRREVSADEGRRRREEKNGGGEEGRRAEEGAGAWK